MGNGAAAVANGGLLVFFPGPKRRYDTFCFVDKHLSAPSMPVMDPQGNIYVPETALARVTRFSPPFPSSPADCDNPEHLVTTPPGKSTFIAGGAGFASGMVRLSTGHFYVASVVFPASVNEFDQNGLLVRNIVPASVPRNPIGMDVGSDGTVYYAELNLDPQTFDTRCGSVSRVRFDPTGQPLPPEELGKDLAFPDGVTIVSSRRLHVNWDNLPPAPQFGPASCGGE